MNVIDACRVVNLPRQRDFGERSVSYARAANTLKAWHISMRFNPSFYRSPDWRQFRARILCERPTCETHGCGRKAEHVDHRRPLAAGGAGLDRANVKALCASCHSRKTASADGGFGNPKGSAENLPARGCYEDGRPRDPNHPWARRR